MIVVKTLRSPSKRCAVMARTDEGSPWVQVASCATLFGARYFVDLYNLAIDAKERTKMIEEYRYTDWGEDAGQEDDSEITRTEG